MDFSDLAVGVDLRITSDTLRLCARATADRPGVTKGLAGFAVMVLTPQKRTLPAQVLSVLTQLPPPGS